MSKMLNTCWDQELPYEESLELLKDLAFRTAQKSGQFADALCSAITASRLSDLVHLELPYLATSNTADLIYARQTLGYFQKWEQLELGIDKEAVAWEKFQEAERQCKITNVRFRFLEAGLEVDPALHSVLYRAQRNISRILGDVPQWDRMQLAFGPGATTTVKAAKSSPRHKFGGALACSNELGPHVFSVLAQAPLWASEHAVDLGDRYRIDVEIHPGSLQFVPKNAKTYRSIVVEPILNAFLQKGIGTWIRKRLCLAGLDIRTQQEKNKSLARSGSMDGSLCTVDLSSASDTISKELVSHLLPSSWYNLLSIARTGNVKYKGELIRLEKFSSMGNAFTFELETLIFWALTLATCEELQLPGYTAVSYAYGDDIVCPTAAYPLLVKVLEYCGFTVNLQKSFSEGPFRESCGGDYFLGCDIRPFYVKQLVSGAVLFSMHNFFMRSLQFDLAKTVLEYIPEPMRIWGPDGYGDGHLLGDWSPNRKTTLKYRNRGWDGAFFDTYSFTRIRNTQGTVKWRNGEKLPYTILCLPGDRVLPIYSIYRSGHDDDTSPSDHLVVRGRKGYRKITIYTLHPESIFRR